MAVVTALTGKDINARSALVTISYHLLGRADAPAAFAKSMLEFWTSVEREQRTAADNERIDWRKQPPRKLTPAPGVLHAVTTELEKGREPWSEDTAPGTPGAKGDG